MRNPAEFLTDRKLSLQAKGLLALLITADDLVDLTDCIRADEEEAVVRALDELEAKDYINYEATDGRMEIHFL